MMGKEAGILYTVGYGGKTPTVLVCQLADAGVEYVVDVRRHDSRAFAGYYFPGLPWIGQTLQAFKYRHSAVFGNYFQTEDSDGLDEYAVSMSEPDDAMAMDITEAAVLAKYQVTCFLCSCKLPYKNGVVDCHRVYVAEAVAKRLEVMTGEGWSIEHLIN